MTKFDGEFLERRMAEHREWQEREARNLGQAIIDEAFMPQPRRAEVIQITPGYASGKGWKRDAMRCRSGEKAQAGVVVRQ